MSKKFFLLFGLIVLFSSSGYSKTNFYQVTGSISSVEVLKKYTNQRVPREEKKCSIQRVPVNQNAQKFGADNFKHFINYDTNTLTIQASEKMSNFVLFNSLGQQVMNSALSTNSHEVDLSAVDAGVYFAKVNAENKTKTFKILVK